MIKTIIAVIGYFLGFKYRCSTFIDEVSIVAGYGELDIDFKYPFPKWLIIRIYKTTSWDGLLKSKK